MTVGGREHLTDFSVKRKMFNEGLKKSYTIFTIGLTVEAIFKLHWEQ
jgi:hypothetical protein